MQKQRIFILFVALALFAVGCSGIGSNLTAITSQPPGSAIGIASQAPVTDVTFKTPEEAITSYFDGVAQNDVNKILQACAISEMSEKYNFVLDVERMGGSIQPTYSLSPAEYPLYSEINRAQASYRILVQVKFFAYGLLSSEEMGEARPIYQVDTARAGRFIREVDPSKLSRLEIKKISPPNETLLNDARYLESAARNARIYGADESTERVVLFSFEQNYYYTGFTLLRYGENWKISNLGAPLAGVDTLGVPKKTTVQGFESLLNGN